jgi:hypothetical protein
LFAPRRIPDLRTCEVLDMTCRASSTGGDWTEPSTYEAAAT